MSTYHRSVERVIPLRMVLERGWHWYVAQEGGTLLLGVLGFDEAALALWTRTNAIKRQRLPPVVLDPKEAKRRAKRENERIKLTATFLNSVGIAIMFATVVTPLFKALAGAMEPFAWSQTLTGVAASFGFHLLGLWSMGRWRSEE